MPSRAAAASVAATAASNVAMSRATSLRTRTSSLGRPGTAEPGVEADVLDRARHRLETQGGNPLLEQPVHRRADDRLPHAAALAVGSYGERAHPAFGPGAVRDVERDDMPRLVAPQH